ncbi:MAG: TrkA family potassium uptake protein [Coriobacteriales bacterium]|nr:TrkA family potassium uptake protein [Coriobacteriales bacterium]
MHVVIGGYGRVGRTLALELESQGHSVAVIDHSLTAFEDLDDGFVGAKIIGTVFDRGTLEAAGIERADVFAAVTSGDNSNIVAARVAREEYGVTRVVARIFDPRRAEIYRNLGIPTIASVSWTSARLADMIAHPGIESVYQFGNGEVVLVEVAASDGLSGRTIADIEGSEPVQVASVMRAGGAILPSASFVVEQDDAVYLSVSRENLAELVERFTRRDPS